MTIRAEGPSGAEALTLADGAAAPVSLLGEMRFIYHTAEEVAKFSVDGGPYSIVLTEIEHKKVRDLIHFIDSGPADGFASGAYQEATYTTANLLQTSTWYSDATKAKKLVELEVTYSTIFPTQERWRMYDDDGLTVLVTLTDAITYSGPFEVSRARSWV